MMNHYKLDDKGVPVLCEDVLEWARWFEEANDAHRVARDDVPGGHVSTVFLGIDHQWSKGPPILYETMSFVEGVEERCERYFTRKEALAGHRNMVNELRSNRRK